MFTLFPQLPLEIQDLIWEFTLPGPRVMLVYWDPRLPNGERATTRKPALFHTTSRSSDVKVPVALHVTKGSRKLALLHLTERFHGYWNFKLDTLYLDVMQYTGHAARFNLAYLVENGLLAGVRNLAIGSEMWSNSMGNSPHCFRPLQKQWAMVPLNQGMKVVPQPRIYGVEHFEQDVKEYLQNDHVAYEKEWDSRATKLHIESMFVCNELHENAVPTA
ncbi:hypothetical protein ACMFMF_001887 [Clarireedia jacksonii]